MDENYYCNNKSIFFRKMKNKNGKRDKFGKWKNKRQDKRNNHGKQDQKSPSKTEITPTKV